MNRLSYAVALLIGATQAININTSFATGTYGDEDLTAEIRELKKRQADDNEFIQLPEHTIAFAQAAAKSGSGVRAKWIELPNCQKFVNFDTGDTSFNTTGYGEVIALEADLSNAIIATCKGPVVAQITPLPYVPAGPPAIPTPVAKSVIYDPVWKTSLTVPNGEHGVAGVQHGKVDRSTETVGPTGDFWPKWKYVEEKDGAPKQQPFQDALAAGGQNTAVNEWDNAGAAAINYTVVALPVNYNNSLPANNTFIQLDSSLDTGKVLTWVELPTCPGTITPAKPLAEDLSNASWATCKPAGAPAAPAAAL